MRRTSLLAVLLIVLSVVAVSLSLRGDGPVAGTLHGTGPQGPNGTAAISTVSGNERLDLAEKLYAERSYAMAHDIFRALDGEPLPDDEARWVDFRLADTLWRSKAATDDPDNTEFERARQMLEKLVRDIERVEDRDRVWVETQESLGDFWWTRRNQRNWGQGWTHYQQALEWWAGSREIDLARDRYLGIVWKAARPPHAEPYYYYGYYGNQLPLETLHNVLEITEDPGHRAHASYLIAMNLRHQGGDESLHRRTVEAFESAMEPGRRTDWYDDALYHCAEWMAGSGRFVRLDGGGWRQEPDYVRALDLFRRLTREFDEGETRYRDQARNQIESITRPDVGVSVSNIFLPGSEIQYHLNWRNVENIELSLYPVNLNDDVHFPHDSGSGDWLNLIRLGSPSRTWSHPTLDRGDHVPGRETLTLDGELTAGAYVIEARAAGRSVRDLVLVTEASVVLKTSKSRALVFFCDAIDGSPVPDGDVSLWVRTYRDGQWQWDRHDGRTTSEGLAVFDLPESDSGLDMFVAVSRDSLTAFATGHGYGQSHADDQWRLYVFTDRPAYRPTETVHWKVVARRYSDGSYSTPSNRRVDYEINDPRGTRLEQGTLDLNRFGSAWGSLDLGGELPLGEYRVTFRDPERNRTIGSAGLFRMEEYKFPEFKVEVATPEEDGQPKTFRVGDTAEADILAEYYFGGPVAGATVEVLVYQKPLWVWWRPAREFPWFYGDIDPRPPSWGGMGQTVHHETLQTDAAGRARVRFETPGNAGQDFEYTIEARVTDASRREIVGRGSIRVSRQRYFVFVNPAHNLHRPQDRVRVEVRTLDANQRPMAAEGRVRVTRDSWVEVWIDPDGRLVEGKELERARRNDDHFPPPPARPGGPGWQLKSQGYEHEEILSQLVRTDAEGIAEITFTPEREGYYRVAWSGDEEEAYPVRGETTVWVADRDTTQLGYRTGGVEILADADTFRAGRPAPVMLSVPVRDSWVLFSVEADDLYDYRMVHVTGTVKLVELDIEERHVPNVFLEAAMVRDGDLFTDNRQIVVPPVDNFLEIEVESDREAYEPREGGTLTVTTRDHDGNPVAAEVALGLVDESVFYIQQDYAGDPRQFFYGTKRGKQVRMQSSFQQKRYARLARNVNGVWQNDLRSEDSRQDHDQGFREKKSEVRGSRSQAYKRKALGVGDAFADEAMVEAEGAMMPAASKVTAQAPAPGEQGSDDGPAVQVRSDFRATALWQPDVVTDADGRATVKVTFPDSLTTWRATARAATTTNRFGMGESSAKTKKPLIVRMQAPRFFVVGDTVTLSAVINNNTDEALEVTSSLEATGLEIVGLKRDSRPVADTEARVTVAAGSETRIDWLAEARESGTALLKVVALGGDHADAMERSYAVHEHGVEKFLSRSGKMRGDEVLVSLDIPRARRPGTTLLSVQITPSAAVTLLDSLPYLIDYPYGCTEQTMSRFLPSVIVSRTLESLGLHREQIAGRIFGGIETGSSSATHPNGKRDLARLDDMVRSGLKRLYDFQHADGGWGWWKEGDSDHFMTGYVVWGLGLARNAGVKIDDNVIRRGAEFLRRELVEQEDRLNLQAFMLHALSSVDGGSGGRSPDRFESKALENLWTRRDGLNAYGRSLLALAVHNFGDAARAETLIRNLVNGVKRDRSPDQSVVVRGSGGGGAEVLGTAHWGTDGIWWRWSDGPVETTAFALRALLAIDPGHELIEPVTNWLIKNRRGAQWSNTRDTSFAVLALTDYLRESGELSSDLEYELFVNGRSVTTERVTPDDILGAPSRFEIDAEMIRDGKNEIRMVRDKGHGPIYFAVEARFFSLEEPVKPAGNEIFVRREYHKLVGRPTLLKGRVYEKVPLGDGDTIVSGERVEVVVTVESKNDYEYLVFEDLKPAGLEAVQLRSGEPVYAKELKSSAFERDSASREAGDYTGRSRWVYQELRDRKVAMFVDKLPQGVWEIRYELRAETPGTFHALPVLGHAMYVPEIRCNGEEVRVEILDR